MTGKSGMKSLCRLRRHDLAPLESYRHETVYVYIRGEFMEREDEIVHKAKQGDVDAFAELYEEVYEDMYRYALYVLGHPQDAQDAVSDAVADAFASIRGLRREEAFRSWIFAILINKCKHRMREYAKRPQELTQKLQETYQGEGHTDTGKEAEYAAIRQLFFDLPKEERMILAMHLFSGYTSREIAKKLRMNENTVRSKESRALKKMIEQYWKEEAQ